MSERICPGMPADWLNAWLAAIGALVVVPDLRLRWTDDPVPLAVLRAPADEDPAALLADAWPSSSDVAEFPIARHRAGHDELTLNPSVRAWLDRAIVARASTAGWMLSSLFTDLAWSQSDREHTIERGQLHTPMPGHDNTVHDRLRKLVDSVTAGEVAMSLDGTGRRINNNGLGFDVSRISSLADETSLMVDPCVEILAFFGLALFPTRGDGSRRRQRGWSRSTMGAGSFRWYAWEPSLSRSSIDALLDVAVGDPGSASRVGLIGSWEVLPFEPRGSSDVTRGYGSRRVEGPWDRR